MNERIKELYNQCKEFDNEDMKYIFYHEKFAELIIRECAKEADKQNIFCRGVPWGNWVKKHFGLEE
jgi:hypothetical protein